MLTRIDVDIDIKTGTVSFELPDYGLTNKETIIEDTVWDNVKDELVRSSEIWGLSNWGIVHRMTVPNRKYPENQIN